MESESPNSDVENEEQSLKENETQECDDDSVLEVATAFADFHPVDDSQLCFQIGDKLAIISKSSADWWWARKGELTGYVPTNHIASLTDEGGGWQDGEYFSSYNTMKLHLEMLQDKPRNDAYRTAIQQNRHHIQDKVVLDVGCGTGILSMFTVKHGKAAKVYAVEASEFAKQTQSLIKANGMSESIRVLEGKVESVELPEQVDLVISEWMGTFLLFEWMIESVILARDQWLKEDGVMWPSHATLYLMPCSAEEFYKTKVGFWESVHGFDFSPLMPLAKEEFFRTPLYNHVMKTEECLALPEKILQLNMKIVTGSELEETTHDFEYTLHKTATLHGFAAWFQVDFAGFPSDDTKPFVFLNTGPDFPLTHWKHTVFMMDGPVAVEKGDKIEGTVTIKRNKVWRRHMSVNLEYSLTSVTTRDKQVFAKLFPIWR